MSISTEIAKLLNNQKDKISNIKETLDLIHQEKLDLLSLITEDSYSIMNRGEIPDAIKLSRELNNMEDIAKYVKEKEGLTPHSKLVEEKNDNPL